MWPRPIPILAAISLAVATMPAAAQEFGGGYHAADYGYAADVVRGTYIGAPLTRVPRPSRLVPTPWSYGTYGVPTVSGIPAASAGQPVITVINGHDAEATSRGDERSAARIVTVRVPRR